MPAKRPRTDEERADAEARRVREFNGRCCAGARLAGEGGAYMFKDDESEEKRALVEKTRAAWTDPNKGNVVTKCGG